MTRRKDGRKENTMMDMILDLHMFDDGGAATAGSAAGAAGESGESVQPDGQNVEVVYGKEESSPAQDEGHIQSDTEIDMDAQFESLIKGDYKKQFDARVQRIINQRFKQTKELEGRVQQLSPIMDALGAKYGVDPSDVAKLAKAIDEDDSYWQDEADRMGIPVDQLKEFKRLQRENASFKAAQAAMEKRAKADQIYNEWLAQSEKAKAIYPDFDFRKELESPETGERFTDLLKANVDVLTAYQLVHQDELLSGAIQSAVSLTQKRTLDTIRAQGMRPKENGASGSAPAKIRKADPSTWTKAERERVSQMVLRGERIVL